jgi:VanZ family protein
VSEVRGELRLRKLWLACGWALVATVVFLSLTPTPPTGDFLLSDKLGHFSAYAAQMLWFCLLYRRARQRLALAMAFAAMGFGMELLQALTPTRMFELADALANSIGVAIGWALAATRLQFILFALESLVSGGREA